MVDLEISASNVFSQTGKSLTKIIGKAKAKIKISGFADASVHVGDLEEFCCKQYNTLKR